MFDTIFNIFLVIQVQDLICALHHETMLTFKLKDNSQLHEKKDHEIGDFGNTLRTFPSNCMTHVFFSISKNCNTTKKN